MSPKIYYLHPLIAGPVPRWETHLERCRAMGFDYLCTPPLFRPGAGGNLFLTADYDTLHPALGMNGTPAEVATGRIAALCAQHGLKLLVDLVVDRVAADNILAACNYDWFHAPQAESHALPDPRRPPPRRDVAYPRFDDPAIRAALIGWWSEKLVALTRAGVAGFRCLDPDRVPADIWPQLIARVRAAAPACLFLAWTPGIPAATVAGLAAAGFDGVFSSVAWWDGRASWFCEEAERLRAVAPAIGFPEVPYGLRLAVSNRSGDERARYRHALRLAAVSANGLLVPMGFEFAARRKLDPVYAAPEDFLEAKEAAPFDLTGEIKAANDLVDRLDALGVRGEMRALTGPADPVTALLRSNAADARQATRALLVLINPSLAETRSCAIPLSPLPPGAGSPYGAPADLEGEAGAGPLAPGEIRLLQVERLPAIAVRGVRGRQAALRAAKEPRLVIDQVIPDVDDGRFAVKRVVGETVRVEADIFADGHDLLAADLLWRPADRNDWHRVGMTAEANDRWWAAFSPLQIGRHFFTVEAWLDEYGTFCRDIERKHLAGVDIGLELEEGRLAIEAAAGRADTGVQIALGEALARLSRCPGTAGKLGILLDQATRRAMAAGAGRAFNVQYQPVRTLEVERPQARFASWYELFPRSATDDPTRHGTFADVTRRLPAIRAMGFDTLYFPPIHPIGTINRKGRNNALKAEAGDVGSPYAIGSAEGGHEAIHPALGTVEDFRRLRARAAEHGLELALDFAVQNAPDHPWLKLHPDWFRYRPDGSVRFAENPPKKYEDIVNPDFYAETAVPDLWLALRDIVLHWIEEGIRVFRVDNPHTKPLPFWEWLIAEIRGRYPDVIFLAEAFTRPKLMYRLAKLGFSQSYSYFTWRNTKRELTDYLTELSTGPAKEFFRPHFFVNTPDINPFFLQNSGRPGFLIRAALAATLSGLWGIYSGFELCEAAALPGREEYLNSEKYQIRVRDYAAPGNIVAEIATLNRIRRANPALQSHLGVQFYNAFNDQILVYGKAEAPLRDMILVAVTLDPHRVQEANFEMPLWEWGLPDSGSLAIEDLVRGGHFVLTGKIQRVRLDPHDLPYAIWRLTPEPSR